LAITQCLIYHSFPIHHTTVRIARTPDNYAVIRFSHVQATVINGLLLRFFVCLKNPDSVQFNILLNNQDSSL